MEQTSARPAALAESRTLQVSLTGKRLVACSDADVIAKLTATFKLTPDQAAAMLKGRCVVKRGVNAATATKIVDALAKIGLEAIRQEMPTAPAAAPAASAPAASAPAAPAPVPTPVSRAQTSKPVALSSPPSRAQSAAEPTPSAAAPRDDAPLSDPMNALLALGDQRLPRPRTSVSYFAGLIVVTLLCVALPAIYLGLTIGIAYGWVWYLTHIHLHLPRSANLTALLYAVPGFTGAVLILFLVRPFFASSPTRGEALRLDPEKEPRFFSGIAALCRAIGVSPPVEIRLTWDANASVHFRSGWKSLLSRHKVLTIGMSLAAGLTARQFVGVLAHEFGHFAQRAGMTCSFIVNSVNAWLEHRAYGEDAWDRKLREWSNEAMEKEHWFSWLVNLSVGASWLAIRATRWLMAGLFLISLRLSRYMSRQMEFDADRYEALLAGSDTYRTTARQLRALNRAFSEVNAANIEAWQEHRLLRDLPEAVGAHAAGFDSKQLAEIDNELAEESTTRYWDSHPPDVERIQNAERLRAPGIFKEGAPASHLFKNFASWSQRVTGSFYADRGVAFTAEHLRSREEILGHIGERDRQREQLNRFFNGQFQPWPLLQLRVQPDSELAQLGWQESIDRIRSRSPEIARRWNQANQIQDRRGIMRAGISLGASSTDMGLPGPSRTTQELTGDLENIVSGRSDAYRLLAEDFALYGARIQHAVSSLRGSELARATQLTQMLIAVAALEREASRLDELAGAIHTLSQISEGDEAPPAGYDKLEQEFAGAAAELLTKADRIAQNVTPGNTVGGYLRSRCSQLPDDLRAASARAVTRACWSMPRSFHHLYLLSLGELISLCEAAENSAAIRPIRLVA